jgi:hypothetical protein
MTADGWDAGRAPDELLAAVRERATPRKLRLFAAACCRRLWAHLGAEDRDAVELLEAYLKQGAAGGLRAARRAHGAASAVAEPGDYAGHLAAWVRRLATSAVWTATAASPVMAATAYEEVALAAAVLTAVARDGPGAPVLEDVWWARAAAELPALAVLTRDVFGNPFRPVAFDPAWRTDTAVSLAVGMYEARDFAAMPILADALQDAGCDNDDVLAHCRGPHPVHVRGCWVVDLVLGKE